MDVQGKGLWSEVVSRKEASIRVKSVDEDSFGVASEVASTSQTLHEAMPPAALSADACVNSSGVDVLAICNGKRNASFEMVAADFDNVAADLICEEAGKLSPTSLTAAWQKSRKPSADSCDGAVMGSEFWPSLADSLTLKNTKSAQSDKSYTSSNDRSEKELCTPSVSTDQQSEDINDGLQKMHLGHRNVEADKEGGDGTSSISTNALLSSYISPMVVSDVLEQRPFHPSPVSTPEARPGSSASASGIERGPTVNQRSSNGYMFDDAWTPRRTRNVGVSGRVEMSHRQWNEHGYSFSGGVPNRSANRINPPHERAPRQRGNDGPSHSIFENQGIFRDQGRIQNWQPRQFYADGPNYAPPFQHPNVDHMNVLWNVPTFFHPNFGYIQYPGVYYPLVRSPGFPQGAGYSVPPEALPVPPPTSHDPSPSSSLAKQIEYYFSNENLVKDAFLRSRMDVEGFVPASLIASFNLIRKRNADTSMILEALQNSAIVEVQGDKLRSRHSWQMWLPTAQNSSVVSSGLSITASNYTPSQMPP